MSIVINKTEETLVLLVKEDKVMPMDSPEEVDAILAIDEIMEEVGRDYQIKDTKSQITSATVILTS
jgi:uncharacterized membrane protein YjjP (DUF1212 family)